MLDEINLNLAYQWLIKRRRNAPPNADIWDFRLHWQSIKSALLIKLQTGHYHLKPMLAVGKQGIILWSASDTLALKWLELSIRPYRSTCYPKPFRTVTTALRANPQITCCYAGFAGVEIS